MRLLKRILKSNNNGMSLVELICAIAIMSLVGASVAGVMVVSANSYKRGSAEVELQEDAQLLANQINNLVQDAKEAEATDGGSTLTIKKGADTYVISLVGNVVNYSLNGSTPQPMAENVSYFSANADDFEKSGVVRLYICISENSRSYAGNYTASSRNINAVPDVYEGELTMTYVPEYVVEPNQTYPISAEMSDGSGIDMILSGNTDPTTVIVLDADTGKKSIKVGKDEKADTLTLVLNSQTKRTGDGITPRVVNTSKLYVRRVNDIAINYLNVTKNDGSMTTYAGSEYELTANVVGTNLESKSPVPDMGYDTYVVDGTTVNGLYTTVTPKDIWWEIKYYKAGELVTDTTPYITTTVVESLASGSTPYVKLKLNSNLEDGDQVVIYAHAKHPLGIIEKKDAMGNVINSEQTNITSTPYDDVVDMWMLYKSTYSYNGAGFARGSDTEQGEIYVSTILNLIKAKYQNDPKWESEYKHYNSDKILRKHRFREIIETEEGAKFYGNWTTWHYLGTNGNDQQDRGNSLNIRPAATLSLDADKAYEVEIYIFVLDSAGNEIWPFSDTPESEYLVKGVVSPVSLTFKGTVDGSVVFSKSAGTTTNVNGGQNVGLDVDGVVSIKDDQAYRYVNFAIQRYNTKDNKWEDVSTFSDENNNFNADGVYFRVNGGDISGISELKFHRGGYYRILVSYKNVSYTEYQSSDKYEVKGSKDYQYWNEQTGKGIFYYNVVSNSEKWSSKYIEDSDGKVYDASKYFEFNGKIHEKKNGYYNNSSFEYNQPASYIIDKYILYFSNASSGNYEVYECKYDSTKGYIVTEPDGNKKEYANDNAVDCAWYSGSLKKAIKSFK